MGYNHFVIQLTEKAEEHFKNIATVLIFQCGQQAFCEENDLNMLTSMPETCFTCLGNFQMYTHRCGHGLNSRVERLEG